MSEPVRSIEPPYDRPGTGITKAEPAARTYALRSPVAELLRKDGARAAIEPMLRPGESYDRIVVEVYHAAAKNPEILKCTPQSIVSAVARAVATGLIISDGVHLVPFGTTLEMVLDYKGAAELVLMSRAARYLDAQCHYAAEPFEYEQGSAPFIRHQPITDPRRRGELVGAYAVAKVNREDIRIIYMSVEEIDAIRLSKSKAWKKGPLAAIPWYAKKTVIKQIVKLLPKNRELARVMALLDHEDAAEEIDAGEGALDSSRRIGPGIAAEAEPIVAPDASANSDESESAPQSASDAGEDWTPPSQAGEPEAMPAVARKPYACEVATMPFGGELVGKPLGTVPTKDLDSAHRWALKNNAAKYAAFIDAAEALLELRRLGDAPEPETAA